MTTPNRSVAEHATQSGAEERRMVPHEETPGKVNESEEEAQVQEAGTFPKSTVGRTRKRSRLGERPPQRSSGRLLSKFFLVMAALCTSFVSLTTIRLIACFEASALHRGSPRGMFGGVTSRRLADRQAETEPSSVLALEGESGNQTWEDTPAINPSAASPLLSEGDCEDFFYDSLDEYDFDDLIMPMSPTTLAGDDDQPGGSSLLFGFGRSLLELPLAVKLHAGVLISFSLAAFISGIVAASLGQEAGPPGTVATVLGAIAIALGLVPIVMYGIKFLRTRLFGSGAEDVGGGGRGSRTDDGVGVLAGGVEEAQAS